MEDEEIYEDFVPYLKSYLKDKLQDYKDCSTHPYASELNYLLMEGPDADGSMTYSTYKAKKYLQQWWDEASDYYNYQKDNYSEANNPFENPEGYMVCMCLDGATALLGKCPYINEHYSDKIELTEDVVNTLTEQLDEISDYVELF